MLLIGPDKGRLVVFQEGVSIHDARDDSPGPVDLHLRGGSGECSLGFRVRRLGVGEAARLHFRAGKGELHPGQRPRDPARCLLLLRSRRGLPLLCGKLLLQNSDLLLKRRQAHRCARRVGQYPVPPSHLGEIPFPPAPEEIGVILRLTGIPARGVAPDIVA